MKRREFLKNTAAVAAASSTVAGLFLLAEKRGPFNGLAIWDHVLTPEETLQLFSGGDIPTDGLLFSDARQFTTAEIAKVFRVPLDLIV